ncbi:MAG: energy-coupling factor ABC transporter permease [Chloroflexota bacterium]|nr:energy-coupling factor ABC transporter permease [Chloroflexota bacterium]
MIYSSTLPRPVAMHIPDGFLNLTMAVIFWLITAIFIGMAVRKTRQQFGERQIPLMGVMAAFIFAAQMINFPVAGGTSGHLLGGVLAAIVLGPWAGILVMTTVVGVQALIFQDGGLLVMGANIFNMGILTAFIGYGLYHGTKNKSRNVRLAVAGITAWLSVIGAALLTSFELWLSGTSALSIVVPAMLGVHIFIGIGEAAITVAALAFVLQTRPDLMADDKPQQGRGWVWVGMLISLAIVLISPLASAFPDGLERVAADLGFIGAGLGAPYEILPDYTLPFLGETGISTIFAGGIGMLIVAGLAWGIMWLLQRRELAKQ